MGKKKNSKKNLAVDTGIMDELLETPMEVLNVIPKDPVSEQPLVQIDILIKPEEAEQPLIQSEELSVESEELSVEAEEPTEPKETAVEPEEPVEAFTVPDLQQSAESTNQTPSSSLLSEGPLQSSTEENSSIELNEDITPEEDKQPISIIEETKKPEELIEVNLSQTPNEEKSKEEIKINSVEEIVVEEKDKNCSSKFKCTIL